MDEFFANLGNTDGFVPLLRGGAWTPFHFWLTLVADLTRMFCCFTIAVILAALVRRRPDVPVPVLFYLFAVFVACCGVTHLLHVLGFWVAIDRLDSVWRVISAVISVLTLIIVAPNFPRLIALPNPKELQEEIDRRKRVEEQLRDANRNLVHRTQMQEIVDHEMTLLRNMAAARSHKEVDLACQRLENLTEEIRKLLPPEFQTGDGSRKEPTSI